MAILELAARVDCYFRCMSDECYSQHGAGQRYQVVWPCLDTYQTSELTPQALHLTIPSSSSDLTHHTAFLSPYTSDLRPRTSHLTCRTSDTGAPNNPCKLYDLTRL